MKRITKLDAFESLLRQEIDWCKRNKRIGVTGDDFKAGFVAGLHQAAKLLGDAKRGPRISNIGLERTPVRSKSGVREGGPS